MYPSHPLQTAYTVWLHSWMVGWLPSAGEVGNVVSIRTLVSSVCQGTFVKLVSPIAAPLALPSYKLL